MSEDVTNKVQVYAECVCGKDFLKLIDKKEAKGETIVVCPFCKANVKLSFGGDTKISIYRGVKGA